LFIVNPSEPLLPGATMIIALAIDRLVSEPRRHPLTAFGCIANWLENRMNRSASISQGVLAVLILVLPIGVLVWWMEQALAPNLLLSILFNAATLWFVIGWQSMQQHALAVYRPLLESDLGEARLRLAMIVSRETGQMDTQQASIATVESVLENGNDCLFASLFWFAVAGPAGAIVHRLVNTLDAMWGYRTSRFDRFGRFAARLDDLMAYLPARLTALSYALAGQTGAALTCWKTQGPLHPSPNAGVVIAAGAGAMEVTLGGSAVYQGVIKMKSQLGSGPPPTPRAIPGAIRIVNTALAIWIIVFALGSGLGYAVR